MYKNTRNEKTIDRMFPCVQPINYVEGYYLHEIKRSDAHTINVYTPQSDFIVRILRRA